MIQKQMCGRNGYSPILWRSSRAIFNIFKDEDKKYYEKLIR